MNKTSKSLLIIGLVALPIMAMANDFSTATRVQYVLECMAANPKMNVYEGVHKCSCVVDKIAEKFTQREYEDADTGFLLKNLPADRGGVFRDNTDVADSISTFKQIHAEAYASCRIRR